MMTKDLLALSWALQTVTIDSDTQRYLLPALGNKLEGILEKTPSEEDWRVVQTKMETLLQQNPTLAQRYQEILGQLQAWTAEELRTLLPSSDQLKQLQSASVRTLGKPPAEFRPEQNQELENIAIEVATLILKGENVAETAKTVLPDQNKLTKPGSQ